MTKLNPFCVGYWTESELADLGCFRAVGKNVRIAKNCTISGLENISIGDNVRIDGYTTIVADNGNLEIGNYVHIACGCCLFAGGGITLKDYCGMSQHCCLYSKNDDFNGEGMTGPLVSKHLLRINAAPITMSKHVVLGSGCVLLPGATLMEGAAVGALSLVKGILHTWSVYAGIPAERISSRSIKPLALEKKVSHVQS